MNTDQLRAFCLAMPGCAEEIKWDDHLCFTIGGKMFCVSGPDGTFTIKLTAEEFDLRTEQQGITPAAYMARNKWVTISQNATLKRVVAEQLITLSYRLVSNGLPRKIKRELNIN